MWDGLWEHAYEVFVWLACFLGSCEIVWAKRMRRAATSMSEKVRLFFCAYQGAVWIRTPLLILDRSTDQMTASPIGHHGSPLGKWPRTTLRLIRAQDALGFLKATSVLRWCEKPSIVGSSDAAVPVSKYSVSRVFACTIPDQNDL